MKERLVIKICMWYNALLAILSIIIFAIYHERMGMYPLVIIYFIIHIIIGFIIFVKCNYIEHNVYMLSLIASIIPFSAYISKLIIH